MKRKAKGTWIERKLRKILEEDGYYVVRSAGSFGIADLVAFKDNDFKMYQVKTNRISRKEILEIISVLSSHRICISKFNLAFYKEGKFEIKPLTKYGRFYGN